MKHVLTFFAALLLAQSPAISADYVFQAGHASLQEFALGDMPYPADNQPNAARIALGKTLFFDPRLSGAGNMSCASCHNPALGWSDALPTARGDKSEMLGRASPTLFNTGYNSIQMWDGRKKSLEHQAMGPMQANVEMNTDLGKLFQWLGSNEGYKSLFAAAYPGEALDENTLSKAIATFERTVVSKNAPFDRWLKGDASALSAQQVEGFKLFAGKANCVVCHSGGNFTDNGFHNLGLASGGGTAPDLGRFGQKAVKAMRGAFKTPTLREVTRTAPYFHDGSARSLMEVVEHYDRGGDVKTNLSPNMHPLGLRAEEKKALVAFLESLTSPFVAVTLPELPAK
jgi:cytochrome c peroxidase